MGFTNAKAPAASAASTGISLSISGKDAATVRLNFTVAAQMEIFGELIHGKRFDAGIGRGQDEGRLLLVAQEHGALVAQRAVRDATTLRMTRWDLLPQGSVKAAPCELYERSETGLLFILPQWTRPGKPGGKMDQEFGLKRPGGGER